MPNKQSETETMSARCQMLVEQTYDVVAPVYNLDFVGHVVELANIITDMAATQQEHWIDVTLLDGRVFRISDYFPLLQSTLWCATGEAIDQLSHANDAESIRAAAPFAFYVLDTTQKMMPQSYQAMTQALEPSVVSAYARLLEIAETHHQTVTIKPSMHMADKNALTAVDDLLSLRAFGEDVYRVFGESSKWNLFPHRHNVARIAPETFSRAILTHIALSGSAASEQEELTCLVTAIHCAEAASAIVEKSGRHKLMNAFNILAGTLESYDGMFSRSSPQGKQFANVLKQRLYSL